MLAYLKAALVMPQPPAMDELNLLDTAYRHALQLDQPAAQREDEQRVVAQSGLAFVRILAQGATPEASIFYLGLEAVLYRVLGADNTTNECLQKAATTAMRILPVGHALRLKAVADLAVNLQKDDADRAAELATSEVELVRKHASETNSPAGGVYLGMLVELAGSA